MYILPAIDLYKAKAVRLYKGDYDKMTVYSTEPAKVALDFLAAGAEQIHIVDLEGADSDGLTPNFEVVEEIIKKTSLSVEVGGGIRSAETIEKYLSIGAARVILGTAAIENEGLLIDSVKEYGGRIAVGADILDGEVRIKGWRSGSNVSCGEFFNRLQSIGVKTVICTDISRDGAMRGTNRELYRELSEKYSVNIIASGGVSTLDDVRALREMKLWGAIIGKAYYTGDISLKEAIEVAK